MRYIRIYPIIFAVFFVIMEWIPYEPYLGQDEIFIFYLSRESNLISPLEWKQFLSAPNTYTTDCQVSNFSPFIFLGWGATVVSPLGKWAIIWPIVPAPDSRWWVWSSRWNENWQGNPKYWEKTCPSVILSTTNLTWPDLGSNPGNRCGNPATNPLSFGTARLLGYRGRIFFLIAVRT
jgi:hypothetical protein